MWLPLPYVLPNIAAYLYSDVQAGDVEGLEHDLSGVLAVLGRVQGWLRQQKVVVFRLAPQVLEDALLHELLHQVPIFHHAMPNRVLKIENKIEAHKKNYPPASEASRGVF